MTPSTELREPTLAATGTTAGPPAVSGVWSKIKLVCLRSVFWTYKRGSWQYDIIVLVILAFIFLTPAAWFTPQPAPQVTGFLKNQGIIQVGRIKDDWSYIVDARLIRAQPGQKPEAAVGAILSQRLQKTVNVKSVDAILDKNNKVVIGYTVVVGP
ncbi:MAG TPA: hypothetical protein VG028_22280 [Terriglobia bacterium]|nr:hypothetical protein [Terriglobia bacterium]